MPTQALALAERIRSFNRFFTEKIGALDDQHEGLDVTLGESRLLFTVRELEAPHPGDVAERLDLDLAYTSRLLGRLEERGLITRSVSPVDRRQRVVELSTSGRRLLATIERRSNARVHELVSHLGTAELDELTSAMSAIESLLTPTPPKELP